ncbi:MAG: sigma-70 family RNA polymerase sigma factor [Candidatus Omnitrophica bacterium]|jgi:RNA polymerase sigma-70 factor (ECF subfamily)|nr:sigma-70 family RNA polymerase sigma factor [Candidatus Omnitrophota bacterium]
MNDLEFVQQCVKGDNRSWNEFLTRYSRLIYKYIHSVLTAKGFTSAQEHAEEIFQGLFSALIQDDYKKLKTFQARNGCSLASWLRQVTINFTIDYLRRFKPAVSLDAENDEGSSLKDTLADISFSVPDLLAREERLRGLEECIEGLNIQHKLFIELNINQGVKLETLRKFFKLSRGAVDMQKARIVEKLKECFENKGFKLDS